MDTITQAAPRSQVIHVQYEYLISALIIASLISSSLVSSLGALIFLLAGLFHLVYRIEYSLAALIKGWPILLFGMVGIASTLWSDNPALSFKRGVQILLSSMICLSLIYSVRKEILLLVLASCLILATGYALSSSHTTSIFYTGEVIRVGHFGSKNNMSSFGAFGTLIGLGCLLLQRPLKGQRAVGLICVIVSLMVVWLAKSLGTNLMILTVIGIATSLYLYSTQTHDAAFRRLVNLMAVGYLLAIITTIIITFDYASYETLMLSLGKDPTITGRTIIWEIGLHSIKQNPWLGVGLQAYWSEFNSGALEIWQAMHKDVGSYFGFHNLYFHYYAELGLLGLLAIVTVIATAALSIYRSSISGMSREDIFLVALFIFFFSKSFFETTGFNELSIEHFQLCLFWSLLNKNTFFQSGSRFCLR
ncbi:O-antigen ligase family protein [Vibrio agarivorans]|uniref:O-antigen ligase family protein n=1 Tax=Vibrio agarivorans TaxID=153622 RepID=UPI0025B4CF74|nr:O-antigen ligase family protein [Vibrio agarivorans]MDN3660800.1 O-antigen ligase family protein [Vibrio agarivorans]